MIHVNYTQEGNAVPDWKVNDHVNGTIEFNKNHDVWINTSTENIVHAFRFSVVNEDIKLEDIVFYNNGEELTLTKYGTFNPWPKHYLCFQDDLMRDLVKSQCKIRKEESRVEEEKEKIKELREMKIGDDVYFSQFCSECGVLKEVVNGKLIDIETLDEVKKGCVNTGKKIFGTNRDVLYSIKLENLRLRK